MVCKKSSVYWDVFQSVNSADVGSDHINQLYSLFRVFLTYIHNKHETQRRLSVTESFILKPCWTEIHQTNTDRIWTLRRRDQMLESWMCVCVCSVFPLITAILCLLIDLIHFYDNLFCFIWISFLWPAAALSVIWTTFS